MIKNLSYYKHFKTNTMKKIVLLLTAAFLTTINANIFAQSAGTGVAPAVGDVHTYSVTLNAGNTYAWDITDDIAGTNSVAGSIATLSSSGGEDINSIDITWVNPTIGTMYYVHVTETDGNGCSNRKALAVSPQNMFQLEIVNVDLNNADDPNGEDSEICPADVLITAYTGDNDGTLAEAQEFTYDYQRDSVFYKVTATGINLNNTDWSPQFTIAHDGISGTAVTAGWATSIDGTYTMGLAVDGSTNDIDVLTSQTTSGEIWIKIIVDNADNATGNEGLAANDVTVTLLGGADESEDENGNDATSLGNGSRNQIISVRPATTGISTSE